MASRCESTTARTPWRMRACLLVLFTLASQGALTRAQQKQQQQQQPQQLSTLETLEVVPSGSAKTSWADASERSEATPVAAAVKQYQKYHNRNAASDVSALATYAPATLAVRAPPASRTFAAGLSSRLPARSLQDWQVEDIVLLATIDGTLHARDRRNGVPLWAFEAERPMVQTTYYPRNGSTDADADTSGEEEFMWIIEPTADGGLYGFAPHSGNGIQKLGWTIKELVELSPFRSDDPPVVYAAAKQNTVYEIDIRTGGIQKVFGATGTETFQRDDCPPDFSLDSLKESECTASGTLTLARTEYTLSISSKADNEPICTIKYFEWAPNNRDIDLMMQYSSSKDNRYIYTMFDGRILSVDHSPATDGYESSELLPAFQQKLSSPVARVFDVARHTASDSNNPSLIILPQPTVIGLGDGAYREDDKVWVNRTDAGSWYALSKNRYPLVTEGAFPAPSDRSSWSDIVSQQAAGSQGSVYDALVGVHGLTSEEPLLSDVPLVDGPAGPRLIEYPPEPSRSNTETTKSSWLSQSTVLLLLILGASIGVFTSPPESWVRRLLRLASTDQKDIQMNGHAEAPARIDDVPAVKELEQVQDEALAQESTLQPKQEPAQDLEQEPAPEPEPESVKEPVLESTAEPVPEVKAEAGPESSEKVTIKTLKWADDVVGEDDAEPAVKASEDPLPDNHDGDEAAPKKRKAHRGKRGGRKLAEKLKAKVTGTEDAEPAAEDSTANYTNVNGEDLTLSTDALPESTPVDPNEPAEIRNLTIHTQRVLGNGSGGTFVFEGEFEGRSVAVKRMLPQYYELASQEVTLLESNEDHPNVIRYFCRREDQHFIYLALELCQASLWELFRDGRRDETPIDSKFVALGEQITKDPKRILQQMAEGLKYLHSFRIVHRDIKPQNMLIAYPKKNNLNSFPRIVISDFGLCKTLPENVSTLAGTTNNAGTAGWKAPELIFQPRDATSSASQVSGSDSAAPDPNNPNNTPAPTAGVKRAVDIFSLGCVFFYVLTRGSHPFDDEEGWLQLRERNIKIGRANFKPLELFGPETTDLVRWMLHPRPECRPTAAQVLAHPFFWEPEERLEFLSSASDRFDQEPRDGTSPLLACLESRAPSIIPSVVLGPGQAWAAEATHSHLRPDFANSKSSRGRQNPQPVMQTSMSLPIPEPNFLVQLDRAFVATLGRQRKYHPGQLADLLRALRNKHHHSDDMPDDVKARVGGVPFTPEGYLRYWETRFPALVIGVWRTVRGDEHVPGGSNPDGGATESAFSNNDNSVSQERRFNRWFGAKGAH